MHFVTEQSDQQTITVEWRTNLSILHGASSTAARASSDGHIYALRARCDEDTGLDAFAEEDVMHLRVIADTRAVLGPFDSDAEIVGPYVGNFDDDAVRSLEGPSLINAPVPFLSNLTLDLVDQEAGQNDVVRINVHPLGTHEPDRIHAEVQGYETDESVSDFRGRYTLFYNRSRSLPPPVE